MRCPSADFVSSRPGMSTTRRIRRILCEPALHEVALPEQDKGVHERVSSNWPDRRSLRGRGAARVVQANGGASSSEFRHVGIEKYYRKNIPSWWP